jgi:hypothetical protein
MDENNLKIFENWREASQKFDYFVTGLIGALVAFIGQSFKPVPLGFNPGTLEFLALLILISSFWVAFKRIESNTENLKLAFEQTQLEDLLIDLISAKESGKVAYSTQTGQPLSDIERDALIASTQSQYNEKKVSLKHYSDYSGKYYHWRNNLLIYGFALLLIARVLKSYTCAP